MPISLVKVFRFLHSTCWHCKEGEEIVIYFSPFFLSNCFGIGDAVRAAERFLPPFMYTEPVVVHGGPDHYARLETAKLFLRLISSRR